MSNKHQAHKTITDYFRGVAIPVTASECIGLSYDEIVQIHRKYDIAKPDKKNPDLIIEIRFSEATLSCRIRDNVCIEAYLQTDDIN